MSDTTTAVTSPSAPIESAEGIAAPVADPPPKSEPAPQVTRAATVDLIAAALANIDKQNRVSAVSAVEKAISPPENPSTFDAAAFDAIPAPPPPQQRNADGTFASPEDETPQARQKRYDELREDYGDQKLVDLAKANDRLSDDIKAIKANGQRAEPAASTLAAYIATTFSARFPELAAPERLQKTAQLVDQFGTALFEVHKKANPNATPQQLAKIEKDAIEGAVLHVARQFGATEKRPPSSPAARAASAEASRTIPPNGASQGSPLSNVPIGRSAREQGVAAIAALLR